MTTVRVITRDGERTIRADTAEALGIVPDERIGQRLFEMAAREDFDRSRDERRAG